MEIEPDKWSVVTLGVMSLEAIQRLYQPESLYRVIWNKYPPNTEFVGWSQARRLYLISGSCVISVAEHSWHLSASEFSDLPKGDYHFFVLSDTQVELVSVWKISESADNALTILSDTAFLC